jgi:hypothetical protein
MIKIWRINMEDNFFKYWFEGFERSIQNLENEDKISILKECGRSCSDSYTKKIYTDEYKSSKDINDFLYRLKSKFPEIEFTVIQENKIFEIAYKYCACDLVKKGYIKNSLLCECSRQSLLNNWSAIFGEDKVEVNLQQSILQGYTCCKFKIYLK